MYPYNPSNYTLDKYSKNILKLYNITEKQVRTSLSGYIISIYDVYRSKYVQQIDKSNVNDKMFIILIEQDTDLSGSMNEINEHGKKYGIYYYGISGTHSERIDNVYIDQHVRYESSKILDIYTQ